jgi:hypothetical protein
MYINTHLRKSKSSFIFILGLLCIWTNLQAQHPVGKWYKCQPLPGLSGLGQVLFADSLVGYYIGIDTGFVTMDGGQTWSPLHFPSNARPASTFLYAPDRNTIISYQRLRTSDIDGFQFPGIIKSNDMGATWSVYAAKSWQPSAVKAFTMWNANDGFRIWLDDITYKDTAAVTHDGGKTWTDIRGDATLSKYTTKLKGTGALALSAAWADSLHGAISISKSSAASSSTAYPVLITTDGGRSWTETFPKLNNDATVLHTFTYAYRGSQTLWVQPSVLTKIAEYFYYSTDFGSTWANTKPFARNELGASTKAAVLQLAPVSPKEAWAILASDTEHPDLTRFVAYNDLATGWSRGDTIKFGVAGGSFGWKLNETPFQFIDKEHGWVTASQTYFDQINKIQVTKDSLFIFNFRTSPPPTSAVEETPVLAALRCIPNPATTKIKIGGLAPNEKIKELHLMNILGNEPSHILLYSDSEIDIHMLKAGYYFIDIQTSHRKELVPVLILR